MENWILFGGTAWTPLENVEGRMAKELTKALDPGQHPFFAFQSRSAVATADGVDLKGKLIVKDREVGRNSVEYLKSEKKGRSSFSTAVPAASWTRTSRERWEPKTLRLRKPPIPLETSEIVPTSRCSASRT